MPSKDRTFKVKDVLRIINNHLSQKERVDVIITLCSGVNIEDFGEGPILVPQTSDEAQVQEENIIEVVADIASGALVGKLPEFGFAVADSVLRSELLSSLTRGLFVFKSKENKVP